MMVKVMLWPLFILGFVVLVTSWPSASTLAENLNDATWRELTEMFPQKSLQWMSSYNPESAGPGSSKRALTVLSRWKPFSLGFSNLLGRYPPRAPQVNKMAETNFVSPNTGGTLRPIGQPLRWGRR
ncbi:uncharacterized protein LOC110837927 isoform X2 [Zootermopsis nevadensis]|uniref:uncharacterized protein LOC110837927 isoform X2 n=1 Tax=Zootermopsis nevadensis TaxID=136037 RepID=UPI000B8EDF38|nr:uncharacterized protein LOC110837927 isoform X2 [Zootermopsis nevadensis]